MSLNQFYRIVRYFTQFYLVLPSFIGLGQIGLGFTGFYWVLLGFTGFYWVLPGFTGFYRVFIRHWSSDELERSDSITRAIDFFCRFVLAASRDFLFLFGFDFAPNRRQTETRTMVF